MMNIDPWSLFKGGGPTGLLDKLKDAGVDTEKLRSLVIDNKELMLWLFDIANIEKMRTKEFPSWTKEEAFYEAQATPTDVFRMLSGELENESKIAQMKIEDNIANKRYTE